MTKKYLDFFLYFSSNNRQQLNLKHFPRIESSKLFCELTLHNTRLLLSCVTFINLFFAQSNHCQSAPTLR